VVLRFTAAPKVYFICSGIEMLFVFGLFDTEVAWDGSRHNMLQNAEDLLCPENARFHKVGSTFSHFVWRLLAAFFLNATSYRCHALPECSCSASAITRMYSKRSGPLEGSAVVSRVSFRIFVKGGQT
jgi:hypothetical protein